jgi:hypothetical protein
MIINRKFIFALALLTPAILHPLIDQFPQFRAAHQATERRAPDNGAAGLVATAGGARVGFGGRGL